MSGDPLLYEPGEDQFSVDREDGLGYTRYAYDENGDPFVIEAYERTEPQSCEDEE